MSYRAVSPIPHLEPRPLRGMGALLDASPFTNAWYVPLIETLNLSTAARTYRWGPMRYLSMWDAMNYYSGLNSYSGNLTQEATLYQWTGGGWQKTSLQAAG